MCPVLVPFSDDAECIAVEDKYDNEEEDGDHDTVVAGDAGVGAHSRQPSSLSQPFTKTLRIFLRSCKSPVNDYSILTMKVSKKRKFVADGVFNAELNEFLARTLGHPTSARLQLFGGVIYA